MKIHYFQRYYQKENVATANTMLLLSRLYSYSSEKFFKVLKSKFFSDLFEPEISFTLQEYNENSIPDAVIHQESFKIVIETKLKGEFSVNQLVRHLNSFKDEKYKVIITLDPKVMSDKKKAEFEKELIVYNSSQKYPVIHVNTTFELLANAIEEEIDSRDYEMQEVLEDYRNYCYNDGLILGADSWKFMRMQLAGTTFDFNVQEGIYYDKASRGFREHTYLGLYKNKSIKAIGKINAKITAEETSDGIVYHTEYGELTEEKKEKILLAIKNGDSNGYDLRTVKHRYFFVEKFYETDFKKITPGAPMGTRIFDLSKFINIDKNSTTEEIVELLKEKVWD